MFANTSDDSDLLIGAFNNSDESVIEHSDAIENVEYEVKEEIQEKANKKVIDVTPEIKETAATEENISQIEGQTSLTDGPGF